MKIARNFLVIVLCGWVAGALCRPVHAESKERIGYDLYSWKGPSDWQFSVLEGTVPVRDVDLIRSRKNRLKNLTYLKGRLATIPAGETIFWRENKKEGLTLPDKETIRAVQDYTDGLQVHLLLPENAQ